MISAPLVEAVRHENRALGQFRQFGKGRLHPFASRYHEADLAVVQQVSLPGQDAGSHRIVLLEWIVSLVKRADRRIAAQRPRTN